MVNSDSNDYSVEIKVQQTDEATLAAEFGRCMDFLAEMIIKYAPIVEEKYHITLDEKSNE